MKILLSGPCSGAAKWGEGKCLSMGSAEAGALFLLKITELPGRGRGAAGAAGCGTASLCCLPAQLLATCKQRLCTQRGSRGYRDACPANEARQVRGSSPLVAGSD